MCIEKRRGGIVYKFLNSFVNKQCLNEIKENRETSKKIMLCREQKLKEKGEEIHFHTLLQYWVGAVDVFLYLLIKSGD